MFLIIPAIPILQGRCESTISSFHNGNEQLVYSSSPADRARLLRKENAKAVHLEFLDRPAWNPKSLETIASIREAVDIPIEIALGEIPADHSSISKVFAAGANRLFTPIGISDSDFHSLIEQFGRKIVRTFGLDSLTPDAFGLLQSQRIDRIALELSSDIASSDNDPESVSIDWVKLEHSVEHAKKAGVRITALHGISGYADLHRLQSLAPAIDSLVLCRVLNENKFPCQLIWRALEEEFAVQAGQFANLWTNPLEGQPHI